jgi:hypothetical protein
MKLEFISIAALACMLATGAADAKGSNPFLGAWTVTDGKVAPWYDGSGAKPETDPTLQGRTITFAPKSASGSPVVDCREVNYKVSVIGPDMLFEGGLKDPKKDAAALGFTSGKITTMNESCDSSSGDMELDFPMVDRNTILLGLNNMIYTLKRAP